MDYQPAVLSELKPFSEFVRPRVLVVEDKSDVREIVAELLSDDGFEVEMAPSFPDAIRLLHEYDFQAVISDLRMNEANDPWDTLDAIRQLVWPAPVGIVTAWHVDELEVRRRGFQFLLQKPFKYERLSELICRHLKPGPLDPGAESLVRRYFDALNNRDWDGLASLCTEDVIYQLPGTDSTHVKTVRGRNEFRNFSIETFRAFPDSVLTLKAVFALSDAITARYVGEWTGNDSRRSTLPGSILFQSRDNRISSIGVRLQVHRLQG